MGGFEASELSSEEFLDRAKNRSIYTVEVAECGWPVRCLAAERWWEMHGPTPFSWRSSALRIGAFAFPDRLLWGGLIVNTLVYGLLIWAIPTAWIRTTRLTRRWRGRCPACAYQLHDGLASGCPECGWKRDQTSGATAAPAR